MNTSGTKPNTSIVLTNAERAFIESQFGGSRSAAIHAALSAIMHNGGGAFIAVRQLPRRGEWLVYECQGGQTHRQFGRFPNEDAARRYADALTIERQQREAAYWAARHDTAEQEPPDWFTAVEELAER